MSKPKYPFEKRLEVVNHYFTTDDGYRIISARFGVPRTQVRTWVALYEKHGEKGLIPKPKGVSADPELRIKVVKAVIEQHMSLNQAAAHFMLAGSGSVARWLKVYEERGEAGLRALKIGTKRNIAISVDPEKAASALELSKDRRIEDLERQVRFLETRLVYPKKAESLSSSHEKVKVLNELRQFYPLDELLRAAEIPRSTFYYHLKALSKPDKYADVKKRISEIYHENRGRYGYRRVTLSLHREGKQINHKAVQRLMGTLSLKAAIKVKRYRSYRGEVGQTAPNVLQRDFKATRPNEKWVTDVTEFAVNGRKLYLSPVIDLFNNEVISYSLSERPVMNMVENMLDQAFKKLNPHEHPVLHSDQGWQYRMRRYQNILKEHGIKQSMSRKGNCLDNAVVECFFGTLKSECFYLDEFSNISELKDAVTEYIEYYNSRRISLKLKGLTPIEYRNQTYMPRV
ncbi:IS3-like element IS150 family transposase [Escherichia coli]|uniref:IS3-like element IS150 family transposase n=2 Tax=Escherichia coli TaxID=562 RepID=UPI000B49C21F|nr:IS3-like element IS150 family transposase [Escherichia coli]RRC25353.1 IS3-like element IS150 family transposase [Escherichia coli]